MGIFIKKKVCSILWLWGLGANLVFGLALAQSQTVEYPTKPVRVIVGSSPGGGARFVGASGFAETHPPNGSTLCGR